MDRKKYRRTVALMYLLSESKTIDNADIASFDGNGENLLSLIVGIEPVQAGSGDPSPDNIRPISGWTGAKVMRTGKNVYDATNYPLTQDVWINGANGNSIFENDYAAILDYMPVGFLAGKTITLNKRPIGSNPGMAFYDSDKVYISGERNNGATAGTPMTTLVPSNAEYMRFTVPAGSTNVQIELGSVSSAYEPYQGTVYQITFPSPDPGTVYGGTLDVTTGKLYVNRVLHSFTGDENFSLLVASSIYARRFGVKLSSISGLPPVLTDDVICSHGVQKISTEANLYDFVAANDYISFYDYDGVYSAVSAFKANLAERYNSGVPVQACFFLKDPIVYDVDPVAIKTLVGQNNIWADTGKIIFLEYEA